MERGVSTIYYYLLLPIVMFKQGLDYHFEISEVEITRVNSVFTTYMLL